MFYPKDDENYGYPQKRPPPVSASLPSFRQSRWGTLFHRAILLLVFGGLFLSILGSLTCDFLGRQLLDDDDDDSTIIEFRTSDTDNIFQYKYYTQEGEYTFTTTTATTTTAAPSTQKTHNLTLVEYKWMGIFTYEATSFNDDANEDQGDSSSSSSNSTSGPFPQCIQHDWEYMFGDAPYKSLLAAQVGAVLAPIFCASAYVLILIEIAGVCWCRYIPLVSAASCLLLVLAAVAQAVPLVMFFDPRIW